MSERYLLFGSARDRLDYLQVHRPASRVVVVDDPRVLELKRFYETVSAYPVIESVLPAEIYGDKRWLDEIRVEHENNPFTAVLPGLEYSSVAAAVAAAVLRLPGAGADAADLHRHKEKLLVRAAAAGILTPRSLIVESLEDLRSFQPRDRWVLKPADRQASVGVQVLAADADRAAAWETSINANERSHPSTMFSHRYLAQDFLDGPEFSVELLVVEGCVVFANVTGKTVKTGRHPVELGHVVPAPVSADDRATLVKHTQSLVTATGLRTGFAHAEWIVDGGPHLVECAARLPGDSIIELIDLAYGIDLEGAWLAALSGERQEALPNTATEAAAIRFLDLPTGRVRSVRDDGLANLGVIRAELPTVGDHVNDVRDSWHRAGEFVVTGSDSADALAKVQGVLACININIDV